LNGTLLDPLESVGNTGDTLIAIVAALIESGGGVEEGAERIFQEKWRNP
jgi:hypothetical protein